MRRSRGTVHGLGLAALVLVGLVGLATTSGCATWGVRTDYNPSAGLSQARTYAWAPQTLKSDFGVSLPGQRVRVMMDEGLAARGLRQVQPGQNPDFLIRARYRATEQLAVLPDGGYGWGWGGWSGWGGYGWDVYPYTEGDLRVDFLDPRTGNVIWHARAEKDKTHPDMDRNDVFNAVTKILAQYPPGVHG
jgi:hypothetical protein